MPPVLLLEEFEAVAPGAFFTFSRSPDGGFCFPFTTHRFFDLLGASSAEPEPDGAILLSRLHPGDREYLLLCFREGLEKEAPWKGQFRLMHPANGQKWVEVNAKPQNEPNSTPDWIGFLQDVTERKNAEEAALFCEQELHILREHCSDLVGVYDRECRRLYVNPALERLLDRPAAELAGTTPLHHSSIPGRYEYFEALAETIRAGRSPDSEVLILGPRGLWGSVQFLPLLDAYGASRGAMTISRNVNDTVEARRQVNQLLDYFPAQVVRFSRQGRIVHVNVGTLGACDESPDFFLGKSLLDPTLHSPGNFFDVLHEHLERVVRDLEPCTTQARWEMKGELREYEVLLVPEMDESGDLTGVVGIALDVTGRRKAECEAKLMGFALDQAGDAVLLIDENARFVYVNRKACDSLGYGRKELLGMGVPDIDPDFPMATWKETRANQAAIPEEGAGAGEMVRFESRHRTRDGRVFPVEIIGHVFRHGEKVLSLTFARDIAERNRLARQLTLLNSAVNQSRDAFYLLDAEMRFLYVNEGAARALGCTREDLLGCELTEIDPDIPREQAAEWMRRTVENGVLPGTVETRHRRKDGSLFPVEISACVVEHDGETLFLTTARDITERKQAEQERQAHTRFLESLDRVNRAVQGTDDLDRMMNEVLGVVLSLFESDRAFLVYPCDPEARSWSVPMECTGPEYAGGPEPGSDRPMDQDLADVFRILLAARGPVQFGLEPSLPLPAAWAERGKGCVLSMAIDPGTGAPWQLGIHRIGDASPWTGEEERLLEEIGRRLADGLRALLGQRQVEEAQRLAHLGYWNMDIATNSIELAAETCRILGLPTQDRFFPLDRWQERWLSLIHPEDRDRIRGARAEVTARAGIDASARAEATARAGTDAMARAEATAGPKSEASAKADVWAGGIPHNFEYRIVRPDGEVRFVYSKAAILRGCSGRPLCVMGVLQDVTERNGGSQAPTRHDREMQESIGGAR